MTDSTPATGAPSADDLTAAQILREAYARLMAELRKVIVGQDDVLEQLTIALFAGGHCILEGVPGLAKTLMISSLARSLNLSFNRIQFTPDLMPSDITGTEVIQDDAATGQRMFKFLAGPIFANVILADEINRTPPKTQAALLEAMQERQVTVGGDTHRLDPPFFVLATQNPIEQEGTYPLPEAQQDRFMFKVFVRYPTYEQEYEIATRTTGDTRTEVSPVLSGEEILRLQHVVRRVPAAPAIVRYAMDIVHATRPDSPTVPDTVKQMVSWGAGPRAVQFLILGGKARAVLHGRYHVSTEDIARLAHPVLRHRIITNFSAQAEGYTPDRLIDDLLERVKPHADSLTDDPRVEGVVRKPASA
jgi:MoxR-like ATPase